MEQAQDQIIQKGTKELETSQTLTLTQVDQEELKRSAKATYHLDKPDGVTIKSIQAGIEEGRSSGENFALSETDLAAALADLTTTRIIRSLTTMVYDRGNGMKKKFSRKNH